MQGVALCSSNGVHVNFLIASKGFWGLSREIGV